MNIIWFEKFNNLNNIGTVEHEADVATYTREIDDANVFLYYFFNNSKIYFYIFYIIIIVRYFRDYWIFGQCIICIERKFNLNYCWIGT